MGNLCKFCEKFGSSNLSIDPADTIVFATENFVVTPTVGSIVPGWLLVTPKKHFVCMGAMGDALLNELDDVCSRAEQLLAESFGSTVRFEHGPVSPLRPVGCGIDHAHTHIVATAADLLGTSAKVSQSPLDWARVDRSDAVGLAYALNIPYLFLRDQNGCSWICSSPNIGSQVLRRAVAASVGIPEEFDWKTNRFDKHIELTLEGLGLAVSS